MQNDSLSFEDSRHRRYQHYLTSDEKLLYLTSVGKNFLLIQFARHFLTLLSLTSLLGMAVYYWLNTNLLLTYTVILLVALFYSQMSYYFTKEGIQYLLTDKRLIVQIGFFHISMQSASYHKITHIEVVQNWIERFILHEGEVIVYTAASHKPIKIRNIENPLLFKQKMEISISQEKDRNGLSSI